MPLEQFLDVVSAPARTLLVVNRTAPDPIRRMLDDAFGDQPVQIEEQELPDTESDVVLLLEATEDGHRVIAASPLKALQDSILLVNSDLYKSGRAGFDELVLPDVLVNLDNTPLTLRGYPESNKEKLILIAISRYIERRAWQAGSGTLRSSFQRLSRINDERGTKFVYETLGDSPVSTHVYGVPDWQPPAELGVISHGGHATDFRDSWFVVFRPSGEGGNDVTDAGAALLAIEVAPRRWEGFWTFRDSLVAEIDNHITSNL